MESELQLGQNVGYLVDDLKVMTRADLAARLGVTQTNVGQLIRGENKGLKPLNLVKAARALRYSVEELVCDDLRQRESREAFAVRESSPLSYEEGSLLSKAQRLLSERARLGDRSVPKIAKAIIAYFES